MGSVSLCCVAAAVSTQFKIIYILNYFKRASSGHLVSEQCFGQPVINLIPLWLSHFLDLPVKFPASLSICCLPEPTHNFGSHFSSLLVDHQYCCYHRRCREHCCLTFHTQSSQAPWALKLWVVPTCPNW